MTQSAHSSVLNKSCKRTVFGLLQHHNKIFQFLKNKSEDGLLVLVIKAKGIEATKNLTQRTSMDSQRRTISLILTSCKICLQPCVIYFSKTLHNIFKSQLCMNILMSQRNWVRPSIALAVFTVVVHKGLIGQCMAVQATACTQVMAQG